MSRTHCSLFSLNLALTVSCSDCVSQHLHSQPLCCLFSASLLLSHHISEVLCPGESSYIALNGKGGGDTEMIIIESDGSARDQTRANGPSTLTAAQLETLSDDMVSRRTYQNSAVHQTIALERSQSTDSYSRALSVHRFESRQCR